MNWLNIEISTIHAPEYVGSEPVERATWINLMVYCASQENGGIIQDCNDWKCRRWQQTCGVTKDEVSAECDLWDMDEDGNLHVWGYPIDKETEVKAKRIGGAKGGKTRAKRAKKKHIENDVSSSASITPSSSASTERKGKEENRKKEKREREEKTLSLATASPLVSKINAINPDWATMPVLSRKESIAYESNQQALKAATDPIWGAIKAYYAARLPQGEPSYRPKSREKLIADFPDVITHAIQWQRKNRPATPKPKAKPQETTGDEMTIEESLAFLKAKP